MSLDRVAACRLAALLICCWTSFSTVEAVAQSASLRDELVAKPAFALGAKELLTLRGGKAPPGIDIEVVLDDTVLRFDAQGRATTVYRNVYRVLTDKGAKGWGGVSASYHPWHENKPRIRAKVTTREGAGFVLDEKTLVDALASQQDGNVYSDGRRIDGPLPAVRAGSVVETEIVISEHEPMFAAGSLRRLSFSVGTYTGLTRVRIEHPSALAVTIRPRSGAPSGVSSKLGDLQATTFSMSDLLPLARWPEPSDPEHPLLPSIDVGTAKNWNGVAAEYSKAVEAELAKFDAQATVANLVSAGDSTTTKLERLLAYAHTEVRYTGLELGQHSILPTAPAEVLARHYGDCKDKSTLLVALLRAAGFDASVALLASGSGSDVPLDVPGFGLFDHAIVFVAGKAPVWIDPTAPYAPVGVLPYADQDRLALIASPKTKSLQRTPRTSAPQSSYDEEVRIEFPQLGKATLKETLWGTGTMLSELRSTFDQDANQLKERLKDYTHRRYGATLLRAQADDASDLARPFALTLEAHESPTLQTYDDGGFVSVTPDAIYTYLPDVLSETPLAERSKEEKEKAQQQDARYRPPPAVGVYLSRPHRYRIRYRLKVPDGFLWHTLPDAVSLQAEGIRVQRNAKSLSPQEAEVTFELEANARLIAADRLEQVRKVLYAFNQQASVQLRFVNEASQAFADNKVQLGLRTHQALLARHPTEVPIISRYAQSLLQLGLGLEARRVSDKLRKDFPKSARAHWTHAYVLLFDELGRDSYPGANFAGAEQSLRAAIALEPNEASYYATLAMAVERRALRAYPTETKALEELDKLRTKLFREFQHKDQGEALLRNLLWLKRYQDAAKFAEELSEGTNRLSFWVAAVAGGEGPEAALRKAQQLAGGDPRALLGGAIGALVAMRHYDVARALSDLSTVQTEIAAMRRVIDAAARRDTCLAALPPLARSAYDQLTPVLRNSVAMDDLSNYFESLPKGSTDISSLQPAVEGFIDRANFFGKNNTWIGALLAADAAPCLYEWEAEEKNGALRIKVGAPGEARGQNTLTFFLRREKRGYRLIGARSKGRLLAYATGLTLALADKKLDEARIWLSWARAQIDTQEIDQNKLEYFTALRALWPEVSENATASELATMAAILDWINNTKTRAGVIEAAYKRSGDKPEAARSLRWFYANALAQDKPGEAANLFGELHKELSEDKFLWQRYLSTLLDARRSEELLSALEVYAKRYPDEDLQARYRNSVDTREGRYAAALTRTLERHASNQASKTEMNGVAWDALFAPGDLKQPVELANAACDPEEKADYSWLHTQSVLLSQANRPDQAYAAYKAAMTKHSSKRVWPADWVMVGRLAEALGLTNVAREAYGRAPVTDSDGPNDSSALAKQRLKLLNAVH